MAVVATDPYAGQAVTGSCPVRKLYSVTPSDTDELATVCRVAYATGAGNIAFVTPNGDSITLAIAAGGVIDWLQFKQIKSTGTTATGIVAGV